MPSHPPPTQPRRLAAIAGAVLLVGLATLTPGGRGATDGGPFCLTCSATWLADAVSNVALFVPLGAALRAAGLRAPQAVIVGACLSLLIELLQWVGVPPGRTAAASDLFTNTLGTTTGVLLATHWHTMRAPTPAQARWLCGAWSVVAGLCWLALAWALRPATPPQSPGAVVESPLPFTPGYGWLQPVVRRARVDGVSFTPVGNGAVRIAAVRTHTVTAEALVIGRDVRPTVVPIVFVHDPAMRDTSPRATRAHLLLAQRGSDAWLSSDLLAGRWGLQTPALVARDAFTQDRDSVALQATVRGAAWDLAWHDGAGVRTTLHLSPALGWSMLQTAVPGTTRVAGVLTVLWLAAWFLPLGWWAGASTAARTRAAGMMRASTACVAGVAVTWLTARATGTATLSTWELLACVAAGLAGGALATWRPPNEERPGAR